MYPAILPGVPKALLKVPEDKKPGFRRIGLRYLTGNRAAKMHGEFTLPVYLRISLGLTPNSLVNALLKWDTFLKPAR
jgi:hypothetical protein